MLADSIAERKKEGGEVEKLRIDLEETRRKLAAETQLRRNLQAQLQRVPAQTMKALTALDATSMTDLRNECDRTRVQCAKRKRDMVVALLVHHQERAVKRNVAFAE